MLDYLTASESPTKSLPAIGSGVIQGTPLGDVEDKADLSEATDDHVGT